MEGVMFEGDRIVLCKSKKRDFYILKIGPLAARRYLANGDVNRHEVSNATRTL